MGEARHRKRKPTDPECLCDTKTTRGYATYYDYPDGCNIAEKTMVTTRYGTIVGLVMSTYDVLMYSHAVGLGNVIQRYMFHTIPWALMGATFALVANGMQHYRKKDDEINYFLGGFACGPLVARYVGSNHGYLVGGLALGVIGYIKKTGVDNDWQFVPDVHSHMRKVTTWRHDWTLASDPKDDYPNVCEKKFFPDVDDDEVE